MTPPLRARPKLLVDGQIESDENISIAGLAGDMMGKLGEIEPKRTCLTLELSLAQAGSVDAPKQPRLLCREM